jgi:hypothetical protein
MDAIELKPKNKGLMLPMALKPVNLGLIEILSHKAYNYRP